MAVELHVPNKSYDGYYGGVRFVKGVGIFHDEELARKLAKRYDYTIVEIEAKEEKPVEIVEEKAEEKPAPKKRSRKKAEPKAGE